MSVFVNRNGKRCRFVRKENDPFIHSTSRLAAAPSRMARPTPYNALLARSLSLFFILRCFLPRDGTLFTVKFVTTEYKSRIVSRFMRRRFVFRTVFCIVSLENLPSMIQKKIITISSNFFMRVTTLTFADEKTLSFKTYCTYRFLDDYFEYW